jgi:hypothetical protein
MTLKDKFNQNLKNLSSKKSVEAISVVAYLKTRLTEFADHGEYLPIRPIVTWNYSIGDYKVYLEPLLQEYLTSEGLVLEHFEFVGNSLVLTIK